MDEWRLAGTRIHTLEPLFHVEPGTHAGESGCGSMFEALSESSWTSGQQHARGARAVAQQSRHVTLMLAESANRSPR